jgi:short-subunit dehydrogenase
MTASTVLITGAGPGIDRAPARDAAARGHDVIIAGRQRVAAADTLAPCGRGRSIAAEIITAEGRARIVAACGGRLSTLINDAGTLTCGAIGDVDDAAPGGW